VKDEGVAGAKEKEEKRFQRNFIDEHNSTSSRIMID